MHPSAPHDNTAHAAIGHYARLMRFCSYASVTLASALLLGKLYAWWATDSLAMLSSLIDSVFDVVMSIINMVALRYALKPADDDHRFGHTSIEDIAGLAQCAFIAASMAIILLQSVERLSAPVHILTNPELGIGVSAIGMVLTTFLVVLQTYTAKKTGSLIIAADRIHYVGDILFNMGVIAAYALSSYGHIPVADPLIAILIAVIVLWNTRPLAIRAFDNLMDKEMPDSEKMRILDIVRSMPDIKGFHRLKTRYSGVRAFIQLHVEIEANLNFRDAHHIADNLEKAIETAFKEAEVIIHADPV